MTTAEQNGQPRECGADVAAYALGALGPSEAEAFRRHLQICVVCPDELASFRQVVEILPMSAPRHKASAPLRRRVLDSVEKAPRSDGKRQRRNRPLAVRGGPRPALALGALVAAIAITIGAFELSASDVTATKVYDASVAGSSGSAQVRVTGGRADLIVRHFQPPPAGQIYEVWLVRVNLKPQPTSALFGVTASGGGDVDVPGDLHGVDRVMVTPEPAGGSQVPTHSAVITAELT